MIQNTDIQLKTKMLLHSLTCGSGYMHQA